MNYGHPTSDEVLDLADLALAKGKHWMAYNQSLYFIDKEDVYFFDSQKAARDFGVAHAFFRVSTLPHSTCVTRPSASRPTLETAKLRIRKLPCGEPQCQPAVGSAGSRCHRRITGLLDRVAELPGAGLAGFDLDRERRQIHPDQGRMVDGLQRLRDRAGTAGAGHVTHLECDHGASYFKADDVGQVLEWRMRRGEHGALRALDIKGMANASLFRHPTRPQRGKPDAGPNAALPVAPPSSLRRALTAPNAADASPAGCSSLTWQVQLASPWRSVQAMGDRHCSLAHPGRHFFSISRPAPTHRWLPHRTGARPGQAPTPTKKWVLSSSAYRPFHLLK